MNNDDMPPKSDLYRMGVGIMLLNSRGHVLMCRRVDVDDAAWQMPQGGINEGEKPRMAALRELKEEIGTDNASILAESRQWLQYDLPLFLVGKTWGGRYTGQRLKWFLMRFSGRDEDIDVETHQPEFNCWIWVPPEHVPDIVVSFKHQLYRDVLSEFREMCRAAVAR